MSSKALARALLVLAALAVPRAARAGDADPFSGFAGQGRLGLQVGVVPGKTSLLPSLFAGGGVRSGPYRAGADVQLALGASAKGSGFGVLASVLGTVGVRGPIAPVTPYVDAHLGVGILHAEGGGTYDRSGPLAGIAAGVLVPDRRDAAGVFVQLAGFVTLDRHPAFPIFLRAGVTLF